MLLLALVIFIGAGLFCFSFVLLFGAPFLPTLKPQIDEALDLLNLQPGQTMLELGCGDGRVLLEASKRGIQVVGYELNPLLAAIAVFRTWHYRQSVKVVCSDFWRVSWPPADGIYTFLLPSYMNKLNTKVIQYPYKPIRVASIAFSIAHKNPAQKGNGIYLYDYSV